jgi:hypothetical protein
MVAWEATALPLGNTRTFVAHYSHRINGCQGTHKGVQKYTGMNYYTKQIAVKQMTIILTHDYIVFGNQ